jgi:hypothetical protein
MTPENGTRIHFLGQEVTGDSVAIVSSPELEKTVDHEADSKYDEEEVTATKESDFKHKQVCGFWQLPDSFLTSSANIDIAIQRMDSLVAGLPGNWSHLWRYWVDDSHRRNSSRKR